MVIYPSKIIEAHKSGLISNEDFNKWLGVQGYQKELKKSFEYGSITQSEFVDESQKASSFYFEKDIVKGMVRFVLKGKDFEPLDLKKENEIWKSRQSVPLTQTKRFTLPMYRVSPAIKKAVDNITQMVEEMKRKTKK